MINDLRLALRLSAFGRTREIVVGDQVFAELVKFVDTRRRDVVLNEKHDSPRFRYFNAITWRGKRFICVSNRIMNG